MKSDLSDKPHKTPPAVEDQMTHSVQFRPSILTSNRPHKKTFKNPKIGTIFAQKDFEIPRRVKN